MGDDTPDDVDQVVRSADEKPAGAKGGRNEDKNKDEDEDGELIDLSHVE